MEHMEGIFCDQWNIKAPQAPRFSIDCSSLKNTSVQFYSGFAILGMQLKVELTDFSCFPSTVRLGTIDIQPCNNNFHFEDAKYISSLYVTHVSRIQGGTCTCLRILDRISFDHLLVRPLHSGHTKAFHVITRMARWDTFAKQHWSFKMNF